MAELEVTERQAGDVTILDMSGAVRMGEGSIELRNAIRGLVDGGKKKKGETVGCKGSTPVRS